MSQAYELQGVWVESQRLRVCDELFQSETALEPAQWAAGHDVIQITRCPGDRFRFHNLISSTTVMCTKVVEAVWRTVWEKKIENPDCTACYGGRVPDSEEDIGEVHESVLWEGGVIVTPHGWGKNHIVQLRENTETHEQRFINLTVGGWWPAPGRA